MYVIVTCIKANFTVPLYSTPTINNINLDSVNLHNSIQLNLKNITSNQNWMPHYLLHTMCHLLCYAVYKLCIVAACLRPESWLIQLCTTACLCHGHSCFIYCMLYTAACFMPWTLLFCVKGTAASHTCIVCCICTTAYVCHGHCCFIYCMLCTAAYVCHGHCCFIFVSCVLPHVLYHE